MKQVAIFAAFFSHALTTLVSPKAIFKKNLASGDGVPAF
jgi:hypothetical protein